MFAFHLPYGLAFGARVERNESARMVVGGRSRARV